MNENGDNDDDDENDADDDAALVVSMLMLRIVTTMIVQLSVLRTVPTNTKIFFGQFMTMRDTQIVARAIGIQKGNWG